MFTHFPHSRAQNANNFVQSFLWRKIEDGNGDETESPAKQNIESNLIAANAITGKLNEVSKIAESLDVALRETQTILELDITRRDSLDRKMDGNTSIDSRGSIDVSDYVNAYWIAWRIGPVRLIVYVYFCLFFFLHILLSGVEFICKVVDRGWIICNGIWMHSNAAFSFIGVWNGIRKRLHVTRWERFYVAMVGKQRHR